MREANYVKDEYEEELRMIAEKEDEVTEQKGTIVSPAGFSNQATDQGGAGGGGKSVRIEGDNFDNYRSTTTNKQIISDREKSLSDKNFYNFSLQNSGEMLKEEKNFDQLFQP